MNVGGRPVHSMIKHGHMQRELRRILAANKRRSYNKHAGAKRLTLILKERHIIAHYHTVRKCLRKWMKF